MKKIDSILDEELRELFNKYNAVGIIQKFLKQNGYKGSYRRLSERLRNLKLYSEYCRGLNNSQRKEKLEEYLSKRGVTKEKLIEAYQREQSQHELKKIFSLKCSCRKLREYLQKEKIIMSLNDPRRHRTRHKAGMLKKKEKGLCKPGNWLGAFSKELGHICRGKFEFAYCKYLRSLGIKYEYEPKTFVCKESKRNHTPDLYLSETDEWIDIQLHIKRVDTEKLLDFRHSFPDLKHKVITYLEVADKIQEFVPGGSIHGKFNPEET